METFLELLLIPSAVGLLIALIDVPKLGKSARLYLGVISIVVALGAAVGVYYFREAKSHLPVESVPSISPAAKNAGPSPIDVTKDFDIKTVVVRKGGYQDFQWGSTKIRVNLLNITEHRVPNALESSAPPQAVVLMDTEGGLVYGGPETTYVKTNTYDVPEGISEDEPRSMYFYNTSARYFSFRFCALSVDHINQEAGEVTFRVVFVEHERHDR